MRPLEIKDLISKGRTEQAIKAAMELTRGTELEDVAIGISRSQRSFKKKSMMGVLSSAEERQEEALVTSRLLDLLNEYEILQVKAIKSNFDQLQAGLAEAEPTPEVEAAVQQVTALAGDLDPFEFEELGKEEKTDRIGKVGKFLEDLADPGSRTGKVIAMVKDGVSIVQDIAESYNSVAEWVGLPVVPRFFLKKN